MRLLPGVELDLDPAGWRESDGERLRLLIARVCWADGYYDAGPWVQVEGWDLDSGIAVSVHVRLREGRGS